VERRVAVYDFINHVHNTRVEINDRSTRNPLRYECAIFSGTSGQTNLPKQARLPVCVRYRLIVVGIVSIDEVGIIVIACLTIPIMGNVTLPRKRKHPVPDSETALGETSRQLPDIERLSAGSSYTIGKR
jgi:hypothetical protein